MIPPCRQPINTRSQIVRYTITTRQKRLIRTPLNAIVGFSNLLADTSNIEEREQVHRAGNELTICSRTRTLYSQSFDAGILLCAMSNNNSLAVVTESGRYAAQVNFPTLMK